MQCFLMKGWDWLGDGCYIQLSTSNILVRGECSQRFSWPTSDFTSKITGQISNWVHEGTELIKLRIWRNWMNEFNWAKPQLSLYFIFSIIINILIIVLVPVLLWWKRTSCWSLRCLFYAFEFTHFRWFYIFYLVRRLYIW